MRSIAPSKIVIVAAWTLLFGCREQVCVPGTTQECLCSGGRTGVQACNVDGTGFGVCECDDPGTDAGPLTDAGAPTETDAGIDAGIIDAGIDASIDLLVVLDPSSGLMWERNAPTEVRTAPGADTYCGDLAIGTTTDWRVPTIAELRTLYRGCPRVETGGACPVDGTSCDFRGCYLTLTGMECAACGAGGGPSGGCYWPADYGTTCPAIFTWSSSVLTDGPDLDSRWVGSFERGGVIFSRSTNFNLVRCVRGLP